MKRFLVGMGCGLSAITLLHAADLAPLGIRRDVEAWHVGSVAAGRGPAAAFWNPASLAFQPALSQTEIIFSGEDKDHPEHNDLGIFSNMGGLGFGLLHTERGGSYANRYRIGLGTGENGNSFGVAYGWSVGNDDNLKTPDEVVVSTLLQPHRYLSFGATYSGALGHNYTTQPDEQLEAGIGIRPFTDRVTLSLDGAWLYDDDKYVERTAEYWAGVEIEPVDYVRITGRKHLDTDDFSVQVNVDLGMASFGAILPQAEGDSEPGPGNRYSVMFSSHAFNKGLQLGHKKQLFARITLAGQAGEYPWLMVGQRFQLQRFLRQMDEAEKNPRLKGLFLDIKPDFRADWALLREIRERVAEFKAKTGGEVAVYAHGLDLSSLYLASVADRRALLPVGEAQIDNLGSEQLYLADALEEAGLDYIRLNIGAYKGAGENLDKNAMSPEVKENVGRCLNDIYAHVSSTIREGYGLDEQEMDGLFGHWFITKDKLRKLGLVDTLLYDDQVEDWVCRREADDDDEKEGDGFTISLGFDSKKLKELKGDRVVSLASLSTPKIKRRWGEKPEVAVIYASGPIYSGRSLGPLAIGDETLVAQFKAAREDDNIKAVVFHIDSPGGSGYASDLVWREMVRLKKKKPLVVVQGFLAASGGYYLSMAADTIISSPVTVTGSIGVAAGFFVDKGLMDNAKFRQDGVWAGKKESLGGAMLAAPLDIKAGSAQLRLPALPMMGRPLTPTQSDDLHHLIGDFYKDFVQKAADGRGKSWDELHAIAEGRIWSGTVAQELGLVDLQGGLRDGIEIARVKAGLKKDDMKLREIHPQLSFSDLVMLLQSMGQGGGLSAAQQRVLEQQAGLVRDMRLGILGSGKPELLIDDAPFLSGRR